MAIRPSDYENFSYSSGRKKITPVFKRHRDNKSKFLFDIKINGQRFRKVHRAPKEAENGMAVNAENAFDSFKEHCKAKQKADTNNINLDTTVQEYYLEWLDSKLKGWGKWQIKNVKGAYTNRIDNHIGKKKVKDVTPADITRTMNASTDMSKRTQKGIIEVLIPLFEQAIDDKIIIDSPVLKKHRIKRKAQEEKKIILDAEDKYRKVHVAIHNEFKDEPKIRAAFLFGFYGRRITETLKLKWEDVSFNTKTYKIRAVNNKSRTDASYPLPDDVVTALLEIEPEKESDFIFSSDKYLGKHMVDLRKYYPIIRKASGIEEFGFHWMRNLCVSALSSMGVEEIHLSAMLGHNDTTSVRQYLTLQREASSKQAIEASKRFLEIKKNKNDLTKQFDEVN